MKRVMIFAVSVALIGAGYWWANRSTEPDYYVCAILPSEVPMELPPFDLDHPNRPLCTKEQEAMRRKYYGGTASPHGTFIDARR